MLCPATASAERPIAFPKTPDFFRVSGLYYSSLDPKQTTLEGPDAINPERRERINKLRWTKGQHRLPETIAGSRFDLNKDGTPELIILTGEGHAFAPNRLVVRIDSGKTEIIGAFHGSFGLVRREEGWDDIVVFQWGPKGVKTRILMRFEDGSYKPVSRAVED